MVKFPLKKFSRHIMAGMVLALFSVGLGILPAASPASAQLVNTDFDEAVANLSFRLRVDGGIEPVLTVDVERSRFCQGSQGGAVNKRDFLNVSFISHERSGSTNEACTHEVAISFFGFDSCTASVVKDGQSTDLSSAAGNSRAVRILRVSGDGSPNFRTGRGALKAIDDDGDNIQGGGNLDDLTVIVDDCVIGNPNTIDSFYVVNPEPRQDMRARFVGVQGCTPRGGGTLEFELRGLDREYVTLDTDCNWDFHFEDAQDSCSAKLVLYTVGGTEPVIITGASRTPQVARLSSIIFSDSRRSESITYRGSRIAMASIFRSQNCVEVIRTVLSLKVPPGLENIPVRVDIVPTNTRSNDVCTTLSVTVRGNMPTTVFLRRRQRFSTGICDYVLRPQRVAGALELSATEPIEQRFDVSAGRFVTLLNYTTKQIPIQLHTVFPDQVFTTNDEVAFRIYSPGACGVVSGTLGGILGASIGVHRTFPAHPRTTQLLGQRATTVGSEPPFVYTLPPTIAARDVFGRETEENCSVAVDLVSMPSGCRLLEDRSQTITAVKDSTSFDFFFTFSCQGETGVKTTPTEPPVPQDPNADPADSAEFVLRLERGWKMFAYNGEDGATPSSLISGTNIRSIWSWDIANQRWLGYEAGRVDTLKALVKGEAIFIYIPVETDVILRPGNLLSVVGDSSSVVLSPRYNLIAYDGPSRDVEAAFNSENVEIIFRWDNDKQEWDEYYSDSPQRSTLETVEKGNLLFVYSSAVNNITVTY